MQTDPVLRDPAGSPGGLLGTQGASSFPCTRLAAFSTGRLLPGRMNTSSGRGHSKLVPGGPATIHPQVRDLIRDLSRLGVRFGTEAPLSSPPAPAHVRPSLPPPPSVSLHLLLLCLLLSSVPTFPLSISLTALGKLVFSTQFSVLKAGKLNTPYRSKEICFPCVSRWFQSPQYTRFNLPSSPSPKVPRAEEDEGRSGQTGQARTSLHGHRRVWGLRGCVPESSDTPSGSLQ